MKFLFGLVVSLVVWAQQPPSPDSVLAKAGEAAAAFQRDFRVLVADESYAQDFVGGSRTLTQSARSDVAMVADEADETWQIFRDVVEINGKALPDHARGRLERVLPRAPGEPSRDLWRIDRESASRLLASSTDIARAPTFPLLVLLPAHQARFAFSKKGEKQVGDAKVWVVAFKEIRGPMFFRTVDGRDVPMSGEFWIEPGSGGVLSAAYVADSADAVPRASANLAGVELPLAANIPFSRVNVEARFKRDPALGSYVPAEMKEIDSREVRTGGFSGPALGSASASHMLRERLSCVATYTRVRRPAPGGPARPE